MRQIKKIILIIILIILNIITQAQVSVHSSGGNAIGSGGNVAFSIGQVFYNTITDNLHRIEQGIQNAFEIYTIGIKETTIEVSIFPNPTANNLFIEIPKYNEQPMSYQLFSFDGKLLFSGIIISQQTTINISNYATAAYFLNILNIDNNKTIQSFKIIKK